MLHGGIQIERLAALRLKNRTGPGFFQTQGLDTRKGFYAASDGSHQRHTLRPAPGRNLLQAPGGHCQGFGHGDGFSLGHGLPRPICGTGIGVAVPSPVTDKIAVDIRVGPGFVPHNLAIPGRRHQIAAQRAVQAHRRGPLKIPSSTGKAGRFVRVYAGGAYIDQVSGKGAFQPAGFAAAEVDPGADTHDAQIPISGVLLVVARTAVALDASVHLMLNQWAQVLIGMGAFEPLVAPHAMAAGNRQVLEQAVSPFIAHRAVMGMVEHEPFDHMFSEIHGLCIRGRNHHAVHGRDHTTHLDAFDGAFLKVDGADTAGAHGSQGRVIAEPRYDDAQALGGFDHLGAGRNFNFAVVDL